MVSGTVAEKGVRSTIVFLVRKGNPKQIQDWDDLIREDVEVITPDPKSSGGACWNFLAALSYAKTVYKEETEQQDFMRKLYSRVSVMDSGARGATTTFVENKKGDVLVAWENEAITIQNSYAGEYEIINPSVSILAQPSVAIVDDNADANGTQEVSRQYLEYLCSDEAQRLIGTYGYRPADAEILKEAAAKVDFMGVNYYQTTVVEYNPIDGVGASHEMNTTGKKGTAKVQGVPGLFKNPSNQFLPTTDWDWTIDPMGIRMCCREITSRYDLPIVISENGLGAFDKFEDGKIHDPYRIDYLKRHIEELKKACDDGCRVLAYCTWSYTDLLSWLNGYQKRYGFVYVDREEDENSGTLNRYKKDSFDWYKHVIETNGEEL